MAKQVVEWEDCKGERHSNEAEAKKADLRIAAETFLDSIGIVDKGRANLKNMLGVSAMALQPLKDFIGLLCKESDERTRKHG